MPEWSFERIRAALDPEWEVESVRVALEATGDGVRVTPPELLEAVADAEVYCGWGDPPRRLPGRAQAALVSFGGGRGAELALPGDARQRRLFTNSAGMYAARWRTMPWPACCISSAAWTWR